MKQRAIHITILLMTALPLCAAAQSFGAGDAITYAGTLLRERDYPMVRDTIAEIGIVDILDKAEWTESELYVLGSRILEKDSSSFIGRYLRGWYLSHTATDRMGYRRAMEELESAVRNWDMQRFSPYRGNMDALLTAQALTHIDERRRRTVYLTTYYYLQLVYELSSVYLELDMPAESYLLMQDIRDAGFAFDFYSLIRMSWICYKYRDAAKERGLTFLSLSGRKNIEEAIRLAKEEQREIAAYLAEKISYPRYWTDNATIEWYDNAADNIISIAYGVAWETDSAITYYEKMPEWFKLRLNGTYLYLSDMNFRAAERQFEYAGKTYGQPVAVLDEPEALESYKNILISKGALDEAHAYLDGYPERYQQWRGMGMLWEGTADYWSGDLDEAEKTLKHALDYPEVFGSTSFSRLHYDMQTHIQLSAVHRAKLHRLEFEPVLERAWYVQLWYSINNFFLRVYHWIMAYLHEYWAVDAYLQIADREEYIKPYYTENPADYFQTWLILRNLNADWYLDLLGKARKSDTRTQAVKFYDLLQASLLDEQGNSRAALDTLHTTHPAAQADTVYEKLFIAMTEDLHIRLLDYEPSRRQHILNLYRWYPQAVFLWGHTLPLAVRYEQPPDPLPEQYQDYYSTMRDIFEQFEFEFVPEQPGIPVVIITPEARNKSVFFRYTVLFQGIERNRGEIPVAFRDSEAEPSLAPGKAARELAYSVFTIRLHSEENANATTIARGR